ncbi:MAG: hypothetical protein AAB340_00985 [Patescibacteria group bacterium]
MVLPTDKNWERLYDALNIRDFIGFIMGSAIQDDLLPIKIIFILFTAFFFCAVMYFYVNSSYLKYQFMQDISEFLSWQAYGFREVNRHWRRVMKKIVTGSEKEYKIAIIEADDFLLEEMQDAEYRGDTFEEMVESASRRVLPNKDEVLYAHKVRNSLVHDVNYKLDLNLAKKILIHYEKAIKSIYSY